MTGLVEALGALKTNTAEISAAKEKLNSINEAVQSEMEIQAKSLAEGTTISSRGVRTTPLAIEQEMQADLSAQNANQRRAQTIDFETTSNELLNTIVKKGQERAAQIGEINRINHGSLGEQIIGMFTIPQIQQKALAAEEEQKIAAETLAQVNQAMQSSSKTTAEIQTKITDQTIANMKSAIAADTAADASKVRAQALRTGAELVIQVANLNEQQLRNKLKEHDLVVSEEQRAFMNEQRLAMRRSLDKEIAEGKVADQAFALVNLALEGNGKKPFPDEQKEFIKAQLKSTGPVGEHLRELAFQGQTITTSGGKVIQGATPAEAAEFRQKINYVPTTPAEQKTLELVNAQFGIPAVREAKTNADKIAAANKSVIDKLNADQNNVTTSEDSFTRPASWATLATSEAIRNNKLWKEVIAPSITDNISTNSVAPADMYTRLVGAVVSGKANINEAARLYTLYAGYSMEINNANSGLEKLTGLKQTKFIARLPQPTTSGPLHFLASGTDKVLNAYLNPIAGVVGKKDLSGVASFVPSSSKFINGLDPVAINNAMALSVAASLKKESK